MARIAMPVGPDFEDAEFTLPYEHFRAAGHEVVVLGTRRGETVQGKRRKSTAIVQATAADSHVERFDALVIPGGYSPDHLRTDESLVSFVRRFCETGRTVAAICHGPQLLIEADVVDGREVTSWPSVRTDLENAGAVWVDREVVEDRNLITSRKPDDLRAFIGAVERRLAPHERKTAAS